MPRTRQGRRRREIDHEQSEGRRPTYKFVGEQIAYVRDHVLKMSQEEFGKAIGAHLGRPNGYKASTISQWETAARRPALEDLKAIAHLSSYPISFFTDPAPSDARDPRIDLLTHRIQQMGSRELDDLEQALAFIEQLRTRFESEQALPAIPNSNGTNGMVEPQAIEQPIE